MPGQKRKQYSIEDKYAAICDIQSKKKKSNSSMH